MKKPWDFNLLDQIKAYKRLRLQNHEAYIKQIIFVLPEIIQDLDLPQKEKVENPFKSICEYIK